MACSYAGMTGQGQLSMGCANLDCSRWHGDDMVGVGETDRKALAIWAWGAESEHQQPLQSMPSMLICPYNASTRTQRHEDPSRPSLICEPQVPVRDTESSEIQMAPEKWPLKVTSGLYMHARICTHTHTYMCTHAWVCIHTHTHEHTQVRMVHKVRSTWNTTIKREVS